MHIVQNGLLRQNLCLVAVQSGLQILKLKPSYRVEHQRNFTGEGDDKIYHAKGHALNPTHRNSGKVQTWLPEK